jgi:hypothetical protein
MAFGSETAWERSRLQPLLLETQPLVEEDQPLVEAIIPDLREGLARALRSWRRRQQE